MRVHHLNCISECPPGGLFMDGHSKTLRGKIACHCLLVESGNQLVLIDTGFGLRDVADPRSRISQFFLELNKPDFREDLTAVRQIEALGFSARDVRHILLTHLDFDHAGGLDDFPEATVHMLIQEGETAVQRRTWLDRRRYRPQQWSSYPRWTAYEAKGERWFGFDAVRDLRGVSPDILMVPLIGHTLGHAGFAVREDRGWLLFAGDAYFDHDEMNIEKPHCLPGLRMYQWMMEKDRRQRLLNQQRLRDLLRDHGNEVRVMCAHDPREFEIAACRTLDARAPALDLGERAQSAWPAG